MSLTWRLLSVVSALIILAGIDRPEAFAQGDPARNTFGLGATILVDSQGTAYFSTPEGAITAIKLDSGTPLWTTPKGKAYRPLAVSGKYLVAMQEGGQPKAGKHLGIAFLQLADGGEHQVSWIELSAEAWVSVKNGLGSSLRASATPGPGDKVTVAWISEWQREVRGMPDEDEEEEAQDLKRLSARAEADSGSVEIDPNGRVQPLVRRAAGPTGSTAQPPVQIMPPLRQDLSADRRLKGLPEPQFSSADQTHVLVSEMKGNDHELNKYRWTIYSSAAGEPLGTIATPFPTAPFIVSGSTLVYQLRPYAVRDQGDRMVRSPLKLVAMDLRTGSKLWEHPVLDPEYYGPFPN
ncbi:MAG TPA: hypothetical protein VJ302_18660 [Blastocatellia bacterium]|nr:hypothetical protein [Blastocatellia bacterium]